MNIVFMGENDWANECTRIARSLRGAGWQANAVIKEKHLFGYSQEELSFDYI